MFETSEKLFRAKARRFCFRIILGLCVFARAALSGLFRRLIFENTKNGSDT